MARATKKANGKSTADKPHPAIAPRDRIIDALMALAGEERFEDISLTRIAERADVSLADFREHFASKRAVLAAFIRRIDRVVLEGTTGDLRDENTKERLFDVLMRRLDAMAPYKEGVRGVSEWLQREPLQAPLFNRLALNSMRFMLEAAEVETTGRLGALKLQGLVIAWARVVAVWFSDEDPGLATTMAELDRMLTRGDQLVARAKDVDRLTSPLRILARGVVDAGWRLVRDRGRKQPDADTAANEI